jgi:D-glycero-D-manno-heptose 1,7-bisphosphate phosphatase
MSRPLAAYDCERYDEHSRVYWLREGSKPETYDFLFLDRDGVLNIDSGYVGSIPRTQLFGGVAEALAFCRASCIRLAMVTNQSGVGRGYYGWGDFEEVCDHINSLLSGTPVFEAIAACSFAPSQRNPGPHRWRKPEPGMLATICQRLGVDLSNSWMVGDRSTDIEAAARAGLAGAVQIQDDSEGSDNYSENEFFHTFAPNPSEAIIKAAEAVLCRRGSLKKNS